MTDKELELKKIEALNQIAIEISNLSSQMKDIKQALRNISNKDSKDIPKYNY
jgi:uncharacterized protein YoxC